MLDEHHTTVLYPEPYLRVFNLSFQCASLLSLRMSQHLILCPSPVLYLDSEASKTNSVERRFPSKEWSAEVVDLKHLRSGFLSS